MALGNQARFDITATDKTGRAIASARKNLTGLGSTARNVLGGLGVGLSAAALVGFSKSVIDYGSSLTDAAIATNTNVEALQALRYAAQEAGADAAKMDMALVRLTKSTYDAQRGLSTARDAFAILGINVEKFAKLSSERKVEVLAQAMAKTEDQGKATGAVMDIIGTRNAPKLMEVLKRLGVEGFDALSESARNAGQVMSGETAQAMDDAADAIARFKTKSMVLFGETIMGWEDIFDGFRPDSYFADQVAQETAALRADLAPAMRAAVIAQENLNRMRREGVEADIVADYEAEVAELKRIALEEANVAAGLDKMGASAISSSSKIKSLIDTLDALDRMGEKDGPATGSVLKTMESYEKSIDQARDRLAALQRENQIILNPGSEAGIIKKEIADLETEIGGLVKGSLKWEEMRVELQEKKNDLLREQISLQGDSQCKLEDYLRTGGEGTDTEKKKKRSGSHLMGNYSNPDFSSPWASPSATIIPPSIITAPASILPPTAIASTAPPPMDQSATTQAAVDSIQNDTGKTAGFFEKLAATFTELVGRLEIAEQQIANAR